ncbi:NAD(P)-dependent dehydrogenase (short-subunit alcohol dehydrogenase family) [Humitalea rosea]|uniref:NAD(P)-dependent dehydrogenase (Short-subunit alcohol dehydrogenase family) n=1 Tax=Humitalea rosea TaxID=990373 RepID=A0A2W7JE47_9PROT|nr:SDR family oxidoreductase [Humitalea rosea]PZW50482.1 NAD(P)-dependent dehydrogenase (short-subunit alcohol dehydrogenase family) [Humitalea rosea]
MIDQSYWASKRVLITAGAAGIGLAIAKSFHDLGAKVWVCDISEASLATAATALPGIGTMRCDVSDPVQVDAFVAAAVAAMGGLDFVINNAGIAGPAAPVEDISTEDWLRTQAINVNGQFFVARATVPHLKANGWGVMVCMASVAGKYAFALRSPYSSSKAAVIAFARGLSVELGPHKIRVNAIAPGVVNGDRIRRVFTDRAATKGITYEEMEQIALRAVSLKTAVDPEEIAEMVLYLCAPTGRAITGQVMSICGGLEYTE